MLRAAILAATLAAPVLASAAPDGGDLAGVYQCKGHDAREGDYTATVTLSADAAQDSGGYYGYKLRMEVPGYGLYLGSVAARGDALAISFASTAAGSKDYGTGLGTVTRDAAGRPAFSKYYYEPEFQGGDHGTESCRRER